MIRAALQCIVRSLANSGRIEEKLTFWADRHSALEKRIGDLETELVEFIFKKNNKEFVPEERDIRTHLTVFSNTFNCPEDHCSEFTFRLAQRKYGSLYPYGLIKVKSYELTENKVIMTLGDFDFKETAIIAGLIIYKDGVYFGYRPTAHGDVCVCAGDTLKWTYTLTAEKINVRE